DGEQDDARRVQRERQVRRADGADRLPEHDREELAQRAEDRRGDPAQREQVCDRDHASQREHPGREVRRDPHEPRRAQRPEQQRRGEVRAGQRQRRRGRAREAGAARQRGTRRDGRVHAHGAPTSCTRCAPSVSATRSATAWNARAVAPSGCARTGGAPASSPVTTSSSNGTAPSSGTPACAASHSPPPRPNGYERRPHSHCAQLMFSTTPSTGTFSLTNISAAFAASSAARRWGVVTTTAPSTTTDCASESGTSPVPGGRSTTSTSSSGQTTPRENCFTALPTIGPRHTAGDCGPRKKPNETTASPYLSSGTMRSSLISMRCAPSSIPRITGTEGP